MVRVKAPQIYSGYVTSLIGLTAGQSIPMEFKVAQGLVASGQAAWDDDETALGRQLQGTIDSRAAEIAAAKAADDQHGKTMKAKSVEDMLASAARPIHIAKGEGGKVYLARPWPKVAIVTKDDGEAILGGETFSMLAKPDDSQERTVGISLANAGAHYKWLDGNEERIILEGISADQFEGEIPADILDKAHLVYIPIAKEIRRTPDGESMKAVDAQAIIEEWMKQDDQVSIDAAPVGGEGVKKGEGEDAGNRLPGANDEAAKQAEIDAKNLGLETENDN